MPFFEPLPKRSPPGRIGVVQTVTLPGVVPDFIDVIYHPYAPMVFPSPDDRAIANGFNYWRTTWNPDTSVYITVSLTEEEVAGVVPLAYDETNTIVLLEAYATLLTAELGAAAVLNNGIVDAPATPVIGERFADVLVASFSRPADTTAYASGDLVANSTTVGTVQPLTLTNAARVTDGSGRIERIRLYKSGAGLTGAAFRVHIFASVPVVTNGDNGAFATSTAGYVGAFDVTMDRAFTDGAFGVALPVLGNSVQFKASGTMLYALIEARGAYAPASGETFTVRAEVVRF